MTRVLEERRDERGGVEDVGGVRRASLNMCP